MMEAVSVAIIAGDEEDRIAAAVASAAWACEVLVLDSESSDRTAEVAAAAGARVVVEGWRGYGPQKNRAAELVSNDWVFSLDADERVTPELAQMIAEISECPDHVAFRVRRRNRFAERPIRHWPWSSDTALRLYDRRRAGFSPSLVHESLVVHGAVGDLTGVIDHYAYRDWADYLQLQIKYARLGAEQAASRGRQPRPGDLTIRPLVTFLRHWLLRGYLLGGGQGWRLSRQAARGTYLKYQNLREVVAAGAAHR